MKTIKKILPLSEAALSLDKTKKEVFLDIETTGFTPGRARVYLVGLCFREEDQLLFFQWLTESPQDEAAVLLAASGVLYDASSILTFNGDRFDLPFLEGRCRALGLTCSFSKPMSIDILKIVRAGRRILDLPNLKQKTIELFLGMDREDQMSGGELIKVYKEYEKSGDEEALKLLLLHNEEDVLSMPSLLPMAAYRDFLEGGFTVTGIADLEEEYGDSSDAAFLVATLLLNRSVPQPVMITASGIRALLRRDRISLTIPEYHGSLRYYFPDYKDYYYLPEEDMAIHKSVAGFVDKDHRVQAGRDQACIRKDGHFLMFPGKPASLEAAALEKAPCPGFSSSSSDAKSGSKAPARCFSMSPDGDLYLESADLELASTDFWKDYLKLFISRI